MAKNKKWTIEEEKVLISQVEKNPQNIKKAFQLTSELIDRTECSIRCHYYSVIVKNKGKLPNSYMYLTVGKNKTTTNKVEILPTPSLWQKILRFLGL